MARGILYGHLMIKLLLIVFYTAHFLNLFQLIRIKQLSIVHAEQWRSNLVLIR